MAYRQPRLHTGLIPAHTAVVTCVLCPQPRTEGSSFCVTHRAKTQPRTGTRSAQPAANPSLVCPHCQTQGQVRTKQVKVKRGISGGKATGAVLTAGMSMLATGLSRKQRATECRCGNCGMSWLV